MVTTDLTVCLLGPMEVRRAGMDIAVTAPMQRALLGFLALDVGRAAAMEDIVDALWADPPDQCINTVQQYVAGLRRLLGSDVLLTRGRAYRLTVPAEAIIHNRFTEATQVAFVANRLGDHARARHRFSDALALWRGRALADLPDCPFVEPTRVSLEGGRERAQLALLEAMVSDGLAADALTALERAVGERPLDEGVAAVLMRALAAVGRQADALAVYERTRVRLVEDLGLDPGPALRVAQAAVLEQRGPQPATNMHLRMPPLPRPRTSLLGREDDLDGLAKLLEGAAPEVVTVTGPGGVGKTRIALAVAARAAEHRPVIFVDLAPLTDPGQVLPAVATTIGLKAGDHRGLAEGVARMLRGTRALLVLDNFEHLLQAAVDLDSLVGALEESTRVLVTSRARLGLAGERVVALAPLATKPQYDPDAIPDHILDREPTAVTLFRERVMAAHPGALAHTDAPTLAAVCDRLDGLPLAIELAAARADLVPPELLLARLDKRLALLGSGPPTGPERHRSLHACIRWSVDALSDTERQLFALMSVFSGGATLASIEHIATAMVPELDVLTGLDTLTRNNLVRVESTSCGPRLSMLETIREFAREELEAIARTAAAETEHADHYLEMFTRERSTVWWPPRTLGEYSAWTAEMSNARLAVATLREAGREASASELVVALWPMWLHRAEFEEAEAQLSWVVASLATPPLVIAQALLRLSIVAGRTGDRRRTEETLRKALAICRDLSDPWVEAQLLIGMTQVAAEIGDVSAAAELHELARGSANEAGDPDVLAMVEAWVTDPANRGPEAIRRSAEALAVARFRNNEVLATFLESNLANYAVSMTDPDVWRQGQEWGRSAATAAEAWRDNESSMMALANAATCALLLGEDPCIAADQLRRALEWFARAGAAPAAAETQLRLAAAFSAMAQPQLGAGLADSALRLGRELGFLFADTHGALISRYIQGLPDQLGPGAYAEAIAPWATLTWERAAQRALATELPEPD